jgi:hypothetical protein
MSHGTSHDDPALRGGAEKSKKEPSESEGRYKVDGHLGFNTIDRSGERCAHAPGVVPQGIQGRSFRLHLSGEIGYRGERCEVAGDSLEFPFGDAHSQFCYGGIEPGRASSVDEDPPTLAAQSLGAC